jgi:hypothetical protein
MGSPAALMPCEDARRHGVCLLQHTCSNNKPNTMNITLDKIAPRSWWNNHLVRHAEA